MGGPAGADDPNRSRGSQSPGSSSNAGGSPETQSPSGSARSVGDKAVTDRNRPPGSPSPPGAVALDGATRIERMPDSALSRLTLTARAEQRLGIRTAPVDRRAVDQTITVGGRVIPQPGTAVVLRAPFAGIVEPAARDRIIPLPGTKVDADQVILRLRPIVASSPNVRAEAQRDLEQAEARFDNAGKVVARVRRRHAEGTQDEAEVEVAERDFSVARAEVKAAQNNLRRIRRAPLGADVSLPLRAPSQGVIQWIQATPGQTVEAGARLGAVVNPDALWIRVPLYVGRIQSIDREASTLVRPLGGRVDGVVAKPVSSLAVPSPDGTIADLLYAPLGSGLAPGARVWVTLRLLASRKNELVVPRSAVFYDHYGAAWVYVLVAPQAYERRRVDVDTITGDYAVLARGPAVGSVVVRVGVMALYGTEFGVGN